MGPRLRTPRDGLGMYARSMALSTLPCRTGTTGTGAGHGSVTRPTGSGRGRVVGLAGGRGRRRALPVGAGGAELLALVGRVHPLHQVLRADLLVTLLRVDRLAVQQHRRGRLETGLVEVLLHRGDPAAELVVVDAGPELRGVQAGDLLGQVDQGLLA